jgi:uncharacterized protein YkwD
MARPRKKDACIKDPGCGYIKKSMKKQAISLAICFMALAGTAAACGNTVSVKTQTLPVIISTTAQGAPGTAVSSTITEVSPSVVSTPQSSVSVNVDSKVKSDIFKATNSARTAALGSSKQLQQSAALDKVAAARVADMFKYQYFSHSSPSGATAANLTKQYGYKWMALGENIARGTFSSGTQIVAAWMTSPGHKANILSSGYTEIGIAAAYGKYNGRNQWIAVQVFGKPR